MLEVLKMVTPLIKKYFGQSLGINSASPTWESWFDGEQEDDDVIVVFATNDGGGTAFGGMSSWTEIGTTIFTAGARHGIWYKIRTGGVDIEQPVITGATDDWACAALLFRGLDTTALLNVHTSTTQSSNTNLPICPDITTTEDRCIIIRSIGYDAAMTMPRMEPGSYETICNISHNPIATGSQCSISVIMQYKETAGAVGTAQFGASIADGGRLASFALKLADTTPTPHYFKSIGTNVVSYLFPPAMAWSSPVNLNTLIPTIQGETVQNGTVSIVSLPNTGTAADQNSGRFGGYNELRIIQATTPNGPAGYYGVVANLPASTDFENNLFVCEMQSPIVSQLPTTRTRIIFFDSVGEWVSIAPISRNNFASWRPMLLVLPDLTPAEKSSGTIDWSDITKIGFAKYSTDNTSTTATRTIQLRVRHILAIPFNSQFASIHGTADLMAIEKLLSSWTCPSFVSLQGGVQLSPYLSFQLGDGTDDVTFSSVGGSIAFPSSNLGYLPRDNEIQMKVVTSATDDINLNALSIASLDNLIKFDFGATSDGDGIGGTGAILIGLNVTLAEDVPISSATFASCSSINVGAGSLEGCNISSSVNGTSASNCIDGASITNCSFTKGVETYAIQIAGDGPADIDISGTTYSGYTYDLNLTGTTGTINITIAQGQTQPTYQTAGVVVNWIQVFPGTSFTNENLQEGAKILIRNTTTDTTISYNTVGATGFSVSLVPDVDYTVGDVLEIRQAFKDGTNYYQERTTRIVTTSAGGSFIEDLPLASCSVCDDIGLDGENYDSKFELDYTDDELDIETSGNWQTGELMTWWKYQMTLQTPMEEFWGAWTIQEDGSFRNDVDVLSSHIDNITTGDSVETTGRRLYRSDGTRPIKSPTTGGGSIDLSWREPVSLVAVGSGVTAQDKIDISNLTKTKMEEDGTKLSIIEKKTKNTEILSYVILNK